MKIIFITSKLNFLTAGGSILEFDLMYRTLLKWGYDFKVITIFSYANKIPEPLPYQVIEENIRSRRLLGIQAGIFKILKKYEAETDVFHIDGHSLLYGAGLYRRLGGKAPVAAFFNRELICWPENVSKLLGQRKENIFIRLKKKLRWLIERQIGMPLASRIDFMSFTNPVLQKMYEDFGLRTAGKAIVTGDPFDYRTLMQANGITEDSYRQRNKTAGPLNIFYSGRMAPGKGFDLLVAAFAQVKHKDKFQLILGGDGLERALLQHKVKELGIENYVRFPGWVEKQQVFEFYKQADIFVQARWRTEMTSITLLEAMSFGIPCVLPGGGGLEWDAQGSALYFKDEDYVDLAKKIEQLGDSYELRAELSRQCYLRLSSEQMNYETQIRRMYEGMQKIFGKN